MPGRLRGPASASWLEPRVARSLTRGVSRTTRIARGPSMPAPLMSVERDLVAARLALLVMRGNVASEAPLGSPQYVLLPSRVPLPAEEMAVELARLPKPVVCRA